MGARAEFSWPYAILPRAGGGFDVAKGVTFDMDPDGNYCGIQRVRGPYQTLGGAKRGAMALKKRDDFERENNMPRGGLVFEKLS